MQTTALPANMIRSAFPFVRHFVLCALLVFMLAACGQDDSARFAPLPRDAVVLIIGDSLVAGTGAPAGSGWPEGLAQRTGWQVINGGVPGDTSADALRRLDGLIAEHRPQAILIAIGGNDFLRNIPLSVTRANIETMIRNSRATVQHVGIVAIPAKSAGAVLLGSLSDHELFAELARDYSLALVPDVVSAVLSRDELRADRIHANARGYAEMAERIGATLRRAGWIAS